ncbi:MAG: hypothetical protein KDA42_11555 [Planctomycetales bacterium]|nr:hypothetical protein [Planctomycetales bacterium]
MIRPNFDLRNRVEDYDVTSTDDPQVNRLADHEPEFTSRQKADVRARRNRKRANPAAGKQVRRQRVRRP